MKEELIILVEKFLHKQASPEETVRLKELFNQADAKGMLFDLYEKKWEQATFIPDTEVEERIWSQLQKHIQSDFTPVRLPLWKQYSRVAAAIFIPLLFAYTGYFYSGYTSGQSNGQLIVNVDIGQKSNMQLSDGTKIWLNSASSLTCDRSYNKKNRIVYLQGEAFFEVSKNKNKPFIVKINDVVSVEALGTSFNVKAYPNDDYITTTLIEGSVRVSNAFQSDLLAPNEKSVFTKSDRQFSKSVLFNAERAVSWKENQLAFEQERLEDVAKILERMYNVQIHFASENLKHIRFSGKIVNNNLEGVLQLIAFVSPIHYFLENESTIIISESHHPNRRNRTSNP
ncbi:MAG: DUF4974 domain-containing protein [Candidatus Symbiothrix sp.]|jgi:ferric-dicitrate binding protein FerR (iron transport regulator)|nr:DUF4974 domain-containing protein [Candidatus Symbiothrix sp.]